ncbi:hypothetical protein LTR92_005940 [Exophiala xenobiotica]|nr:hypothetical protein LTR92_005940 [Exophiala xenobiotica]
MPRGGRRQAMAQDDDSDDGLDPSQMSPNSKKEYDKKMIMTEDLGRATADHIKTSDYRKPQPNVPIIRNCHEAGTEESKIVKEHKAQTNNWCNYGHSEEARLTASGDQLIGSGNSHRHAISSALAAEEKRLGHKLTLNDTYDERGYRRPNPGTNAAPQGPRASQRPPPLPTKSNPKKKGGGGTQDRPWPPLALEGTPALAAMSQTSSSKASPATKSVVGSITADPKTGPCKNQKKMPALTATRARPLAAAMQRLADPATFMSLATNVLATAAKPQAQVSVQVTAPATAANAAVSQDNTPATPTTATATTTSDSSNATTIRQVPVSEFSFSANAALAPNEVATHTDGAPSTGVLSGFTPSLTTHRPPLIEDDIQELTDALVGLGIHGAGIATASSSMNNQSLGPRKPDLVSQSGSLMDSPIIDDLGGKVLVAGQDKKEDIVIINGIRYVKESALLAVKESLGIHGKGSGIGAQSTFGPNVRGSSFQSDSTTQPFPSLFNNISSLVPGPAAKTNPFAPREPLIAEKSTQMPSQQPVATDQRGSLTRTEPQTLDQALVAAVNPRLAVPAAQPITQAPQGAGASQVTTSRDTIVSKWAAPSTSVSQTKPVVLQPKSTNGAAAPAMQVASDAKFATTAQATAAAAGQHSPPSIIGDRRAFGHLSEYAANPPNYQPPPPRVAPRRKYHARGPGYAMLLADLAAAGASSKK